MTRVIITIIICLDTASVNIFVLLDKGCSEISVIGAIDLFLVLYPTSSDVIKDIDAQVEAKLREKKAKFLMFKAN